MDLIGHFQRCGQRFDKRRLVVTDAVGHCVEVLEGQAQEADKGPIASSDALRGARWTMSGASSLTRVADTAGCVYFAHHSLSHPHRVARARFHRTRKLVADHTAEPCTSLDLKSSMLWRKSGLFHF